MSMIITPPAAPPPQASGPPPRNGSRPPSPDRDPFASVLDQQARTATAEGLTKQQDASDAAGVNPRGANPGATPQPADTQTVAPGAEGTDPAALAAALNSLLNGTTPAPTAPVATATASAPTAEQAVPVAAQPTAAVPAQAPAAPQATVPATPAAPVVEQPLAPAPPPTAPVGAPTATPAATPTDAAELPTVPAPAAAVAPDATEEQPAPQGTASGPLADGEPTATPAGNGQAAADGDAAGGEPSRQPAQQAASARPQEPAAGQQPATTNATAPSGSSADASAAAQPAAPAPAPAPSQNGAAPAPLGGHPTGAIHGATAAEKATAAALPARPVTLDNAVETVRLAMRASADRNVTLARISLNPAELGGIEIHLRHTADGLVARVIADSGGAAQLLQQSAGDLQHDLEQQGLNLLALDIGTSDGQAGEAGAQHGFGQSLGGSRPSWELDGADDQLLTIATDAPAAPTALRLGNGALVDLLA